MSKVTRKQRYENGIEMCENRIRQLQRQLKESTTILESERLLELISINESELEVRKSKGISKNGF